MNASKQGRPLLGHAIATFGLFCALALTASTAEAQRPRRDHHRLKYRGGHTKRFTNRRLTSVPELDPKSGASAIALMIGSAVLLIRRRERQ